MPVSVSYAANVSVTETLTDTYLAANSSVLHNGLNNAVTLNSGTTPPATMVADFALTLSSGAGTIDLRALTSTNAKTIDGNGLKVQVVKLRNKSTNSNPMTLTTGATNGYELLGPSWSIVLQVGAEIQLFLNDASPDIAAADKTIDVAGTGSQVLECLFVLG